MLWLALAGVVSMSSAQAPAKVKLAGTTWQFPPSIGHTGTKVTFRKDGVAVFVFAGPARDVESTGHWKQTGNDLVFGDEFTEFHVTVNGNEMSGELLSLAGPAKGQTNPTSLKKL